MLIARALRHYCVALVVFLIAFSWVVAPAQALEQITSFHADVTLQQNTSISIRETIVFVTDEDRHGIFRYIPVRYHRNGLNYKATVRNVKVTDDKGKNIEYETSFTDGNIDLKIGDPDRTFTGQKTYVLTYTVDNAIQQFDRPELFWDITGEGWQLPIVHSSATIHSPVGPIAQIECYTGPVGSDDKRCEKHQLDEQTAVFTYDETITYNENFTVAVGIGEPNTLVFPSPLEKAWKQFLDNLIVLPVLIPAALLGFWWWRRGRDSWFTSPNVFNNDESQPQVMSSPFFSRRIPFVYEPFKDLTPGQAGALLDDSVDNQDVIAELLELARRKFLKIERIEKKGLLSTKTDYSFTKLKEPNDKLTDFQRYLHEQLFAKGTEVKMSDLKGTFYTKIESVKKQIYSSLTKRGFFKNNPKTNRELAFAVVFISGFICFYWMIFLATQGILVAVPLFIGSVVVAGLCAWHMPAKSAVGSNYASQVKGLRETIQRGAWREKIKEKNLFIEEVLPFAVALGVIDRLSRDMEDLNIKPPEYVGGSSLHGFSTASFVHSFSSQASTTLSHNPSSSSYSSGSGFSSGGSSGGGGGGGGGGSW